MRCGKLECFQKIKHNATNEIGEIGEIGEVVEIGEIGEIGKIGKIGKIERTAAFEFYQTKLDSPI